MQALLSYDQSPPFAAPLRFFLSAPLFGVLAGLLAIVDGPLLFASRWTPAALAATHLLTAGFMLQIMIGALIQVLPVVAGANLAQPLRTARRVHPPLTLGALLLAGGFLSGTPWLLQGGALLLAAGCILFLHDAGRALRGVPSTSPTIRGLKLACGGLLATVALGLLLAFALAGGWALPLSELADLHAAWGLAGWAGVLLIAVAYVVVPMFQLTPGYAARPSWWLPPFIVGALLTWTAALAVDLPWLRISAQVALIVAGSAFAGWTLALQRRRRRAKPDVTLRYWQLGLLTAMLALATWSAGAFLRDPDPRTALLFGVCFLLGGVLACIVGMLYKIVPFLAWLHLQPLGRGAPPMNRLLTDLAARRQMEAFFVACALSTAAVFLPDWLARPAGLAFALASAGLLWNLVQAVRRHHAHRRAKLGA
ncbi:MAG: hypothetical protein LWW83_15900 [Azonexaceae bacterium]|nr:hypothetical protein [Azonexaceae bacterium]